MLVIRRILNRLAGVSELRSENRALRDGLLYVQRAIRNDPGFWHLAVYIDALLDAEESAGA